jgi:hypothetical protein
LIDAAQVKMLETLIKKTETNEATFLKIMVSGAETLADVRVRDMPRLELALRDKLKRAVRKEVQK